MLERARERATEVGVVPVGIGAGSTLRFLAATLRATHVAEVGTGTGVSGLWLLRGMAPEGILTSIDIEAEHQRLAKEAFHEEGIGHTRHRLITGQALEVLPRLTDNAYDMVHVDGDKREYGPYVEAAMRILRPGGVLAVDNALWHDKVADPAQRDAETVAIREVAQQVLADERLVPLLLPVSDGLLLALKR